MSWNSGSDLFESLITTLQENVKEFYSRMNIYSDMIEAFEDRDCDTLFELIGKDEAFDSAFYEFHPKDEYDFDEE